MNRFIITPLGPEDIPEGRPSRATARIVVVQGTTFFFGNQVGVYSRTNQPSQSVLLRAIACDNFPRWWVVRADPGEQFELRTSNPMYVLSGPKGSSVLSGAQLVAEGSLDSTLVDIAAMPQVSVWAEMNRGNVSSESWVPTRMAHMGMAARVALPSPATPSAIFPTSGQLVKLSGAALQTDYITNQSLSPIPPGSGRCAGLWIDGSYSGEEVAGQALDPPVTSTLCTRELTFVYFYGAYPNSGGVKGDVFYVGDFAAPAEFGQPCQFKVVLGYELLQRYDAAFSRVGMWSPYREAGLGGRFSIIRMNIRPISFAETDRTVLTTNASAQAGVSDHTLQGEHHTS